MVWTGTWIIASGYNNRKEINNAQKQYKTTRYTANIIYNASFVDDGMRRSTIGMLELSYKRLTTQTKRLYIIAIL